MCNILIIEDHLDVREILTEFVAAAGHAPHDVANGKEALEWLSAQEEPPCIILLDLRMPVMDGWDFLRAIQNDARWAEVPVIVVSATVRQDSPNPVLPAREFWSKPPDAERVERIYQHCVRHRESWPTREATS